MPMFCSVKRNWGPVNDTTGMRSHERLQAIVTALGAQPRLSLTQLTEVVHLPKPTTLRFLRSLEQTGWVTRDEAGTYSLGPAIVALAGKYLSNDPVIVAASPLMRELRAEIGETISLSRLTGGLRVCVQEFPSLQNLRLVLGLGETGPLHAGASGLLLLSALPPSERAEILAQSLPAYTDRTITQPDLLERECELIRERGWAVTRGQKIAGGVAIAVPIDDPNAPGTISALGVYGPDTHCRTAHDERRWLDSTLRCKMKIEAAIHGERTSA